MQLPPLDIDLATGRVHGPDGEVRLRPLECRLLRWLVEHAGRTWPREEVLEAVWGYGPKVVSRTLDTTLSRLRRRVEVDRRKPRYLKTVPGEGIRLDLPRPAERVAEEGCFGPEEGAALLGIWELRLGSSVRAEADPVHAALERVADSA